MLSLEFFGRAKTHAFFNVVYVYTIYVVSKFHKDSYDVLCLTCQKRHGWVTSVTRVMVHELRVIVYELSLTLELP